MGGLYPADDPISKTAYCSHIAAQKKIDFISQSSHAKDRLQHMYNKLLARLNELIPLNPPQQRSLCEAVQSVSLKKDDVLVREGDVCDRIYFVTEGILRATYIADQKEITRWFCFEDHFATNYFSLVYRQPSEDTISLLTDAKLLSLSYCSLQALSKKDSIWVDLNRRLLEHYYTTLLRRVQSFQTLSTAQRYQKLLADYPDIEEQVPLGYLASYLGMSPETLSRLRAKRLKKQR